jgi:uncharacterized LabA/DUF88 family protein
MKPRARVIVFLDYQNVYEDFRRAFCSGTLRSTDGQFDPVRLATILVDRGPDFEEWQLHGVRAYLGRPAPDRDGRGAAAHDRQTQRWRDDGVTVRARSLQYLPGQPPRQKGVDVELAVDVVRLAVQGAFEIGVVASTDTDLVPAIEAVDDFRGDARFPRLCTVSYTGMAKKLQMPDGTRRQPFVFRLKRDDYRVAHDPTVYVEPRSPGDRKVSDG